MITAVFSSLPLEGWDRLVNGLILKKVAESVSLWLKFVLAQVSQSASVGITSIPVFVLLRAVKLLIKVT